MSSFTVFRLLSTALLPAGHTLYVYGGGWDRADTGAGPQSTTLGLSPCWRRFFWSQNAGYDYRGFRGEGENPYYYAGLDCSGYLGWLLYNVLGPRDGRGFVFPSTRFAKTLAAQCGLGTWDRAPSRLRSGDLFSMEGHVWLCVGHCEDGSMVILHSSPTPSILGAPGGGVQLSGLGDREDCQAAALSQAYMECLSPAWCRRYQAVFRPYRDYTALAHPDCGAFLWSDVLSDPERLRQQHAKAILSRLLS